MANTKSARKRAEKSAAQREKNRAARSKTRTAVRKARAAIAAGSPDAGARVSEAVSLLDRTAQQGIVHANTAARTKSRLAAASKRSS